MSILVTLYVSDSRRSLSNFLRVMIVITICTSGLSIYPFLEISYSAIEIFFEKSVSSVYSQTNDEDADEDNLRRLLRDCDV